MTVLSEPLSQPGDAALAADLLIFVTSIVLHKRFVVLIDGVVRQVHVAVRDVVLVGSLVRISAESAQSLPVQKNTQRIARGDQDINSHVELEVIDQQGAMNIGLDYVTLIRGYDLLRTVSKKYTPTLKPFETIVNKVTNSMKDGLPYLCPS